MEQLKIFGSVQIPEESRCNIIEPKLIGCAVHSGLYDMLKENSSFLGCSFILQI